MTVKIAIASTNTNNELLLIDYVLIPIRMLYLGSFKLCKFIECKMYNKSIYRPENIEN